MVRVSYTLDKEEYQEYKELKDDYQAYVDKQVPKGIVVFAVGLVVGVVCALLITGFKLGW